MSLSKEDEETWYELALLSAARQLTEFLNGSSRVLARSLVIFAGGDAALFALVTVASALHHDRLAMARDVAYSALAVVSCALGVLGAKKLDRGVILLYFVLVGFGLTSSSANLTYNITERAKQDSVCAHVAESEAAADAARGILDRCATQLFLLNAKLALLGATVFGQLVSAYLALRLSERIQEESDASEESKKLEVLNAIGFRYAFFAVRTWSCWLRLAYTPVRTSALYVSFFVSLFSCSTYSTLLLHQHLHAQLRITE